MAIKNMTKPAMAFGVLALMVSAAVVQAGQPSQEKRVFNIQSQSTEKALTQFGLETGLQVLFATKVTAEQRSHAVVGELRPQEALERLLAGTGLKAEFINEKTVTIRDAAGSRASSERKDENASGVRVARESDAVPGAGEQGQTQEAEPAGNENASQAQLQEVVVTAQKREERLRAVFLHSLADATSFQISDGTSDALHVAFDAQGTSLYFTASTDSGEKAAWPDMSSLHCPATYRVYAVTLNKAGVGRSCESSASKSDCSSVVSCGIDLDHIRRFVFSLSLPPKNYRALFPGPPGVVLLLQGPEIDDPWRVYADDQEHQIVRYNRATGKSTVLAERILHLDVSADGRRMLCCQLLKENRARWFVADTDRGDEAGTVRNARELEFAEARIVTNPREEWRHMYEQAWRNQKLLFNVRRSWARHREGLGPAVGRFYPRRASGAAKNDPQRDFSVRLLERRMHCSHVSWRRAGVRPTESL